jgi:hypothetical protein
MARHEAGPLSQPRLVNNGFVVLLLAVAGLIRAIEQAVNFGRHDEIVFMQALYLLGAQRNGRVTPTEADVRVMAFGLSEFADFLNKG